MRRGRGSRRLPDGPRGRDYVVMLGQNFRRVEIYFGGDRRRTSVHVYTPGKKRVVEITRKLAHGLLEQAEKLLQLSGGGNVLNTAFIERLNGTFRERLASLTRKSRHAASRLQALHTGMYLIGCTYNFCFAHQELSKAKYWGRACTPAMASGLTDHVWSICELLRYKVAPAPWIEPKPRGRPKKQAEQTVMLTKRQSFQPRVRPLVRLRKGVLCSTTS